MKQIKMFYAYALVIALLFGVTAFQGCQSDNIIEPSAQSDDDYLQTTAINTAFSTDPDDEDNLLASEINDFDSQGPVPDFEGGDVPIDSLVRWGRRVTSVNVNTTISNIGDSLKNVLVTRTVGGNFIIIGYINGALDSTVKPYTQEQKRIVVFKRVGNRNHPRLNWRVIRFSAVDGETKTPQTGKSNIIMSKVEYYKNNNLVLTLNGPDFTVNMFNARMFNGHGGGDALIESDRGDNLRIKVYLTSNQQDTDMVSYHWARNSFGFHRERFVMTSQIPNGNNYDRTYEKTFQIFHLHRRGVHNGFISASSRSSLHDNDPSLFSSTYMGFPYRIRP